VVLGGGENDSRATTSTLGKLETRAFNAKTILEGKKGRDKEGGQKKGVGGGTRTPREKRRKSLKFNCTGQKIPGP